MIRHVFDRQRNPDPRKPGLIRRTIRRRWLAILACWLLVAVPLGAWAYHRLPPTYHAISLLRVDPQKTDLYGVRAKGETLDSFLQTQVQLITSPNVLTAAGTNPKVAVLDRIQKAGDVVQELRKVVNVSVIPGTYLIEIAMVSPDAHESATLVNSVVDAFIDANNEWGDGMTRVQIRNLEHYSVELRNQTDELERKWKTLVASGDVDRKAKQANLISPDQGTLIERKLVENDLDRLQAQAQLDAYASLKQVDTAKMDELKLRIESANFLEKALRDRRNSGGFDPRTQATDAVDIALIQVEHNTIKGLQESVTKRLEQLKYEAKGEARIRPLNPNGAMVPGKPIQDQRPLALNLVAFGSLIVVFAGFVGIEASFGPSVGTAKVAPPVEG